MHPRTAFNHKGNYYAHCDLPSYAGGFKEAVAEVKALEKAGLDVVWVPEAYSLDAPSAMGYIAAETERVTIASGICLFIPARRASP